MTPETPLQVYYLSDRRNHLTSSSWKATKPTYHPPLSSSAIILHYQFAKSSLATKPTSSQNTVPKQYLSHLD